MNNSLMTLKKNDLVICEGNFGPKEALRIKYTAENVVATVYGNLWRKRDGMTISGLPWDKTKIRLPRDGEIQEMLDAGRYPGGLPKAFI